MSSSQEPFAVEESAPDLLMMEAPDSPPDMSHLNSSSTPSSSQSQQPATSGQKVNGETKVNHGAPGSSYNTKKFQEEFERFFNQLLDQDWKPSQYGDPLLH